MAISQEPSSVTSRYRLAQTIAPHVESIRRETHPESGATVTQLTSSALIHTHIYPESPVFTPDSRRFVYQRFASLDRPREYWICDLGAADIATNQLRPLTTPEQEPSVHGPVVTPDGQWFVYVSVPEVDGVVILRGSRAALRVEYDPATVEARVEDVPRVDLAEGPTDLRRVAFVWRQPAQEGRIQLCLTPTS